MALPPDAPTTGPQTPPQAPFQSFNPNNPAFNPNNPFSPPDNPLNTIPAPPPFGPQPPSPPPSPPSLPPPNDPTVPQPPDPTNFNLWGVLSPQCFAAGTWILLADGSQEAIENIVVGQSVMAFEALGELVPCRSLVPKRYGAVDRTVV
jgi:hypothetical protein